ncbi:MAG: class I tRNA ligase family protein, partial [Chlamydiia bacterium]|nr:class I tRNA ligase family protein [Chlamydiia bacterium]
MIEASMAYDPKNTEEKWYSFWEEQGYFKADPHSSKPKFSLVMPPPNVTGQLHMGHALVSTLQDVIVRFKRMSGFETLWIPGTDHAGISTQTVVERHLIQTEGKRRTDYNREDFLKHVWQWKEQHQDHILNQLRKVGCSCDWSRLCFTLDEGASNAVQTVFTQLQKQNLIYRGDYLVNWDPVTQTALADDEVEYEDEDSYLWHVRYPIEGTDEALIIATTRPETILGDTAVAVAPGDERYQHLVGKMVRLPLSERFIPIIEDHHVDPAFGTGAL